MPPIKNAEGKTYPWAVKGMDFAMYASVHNFTMQMPDFVGILDQKKKREACGLQEELLNTVVFENDPLEAEHCDQIVGCEDPDNPIIKSGVLGGAYRKYITPDEQKATLNIYERGVAFQKEVSEKMRSAYQGKTDERSLHMQDRANEVADLYDNLAEMANPKAGNIVEAEMHSPYLSALNNLFTAAPKFGTKGLEQCVDVLEQNGGSNGKDIFDDYMTLMNAGPKETKIQYHRQEMEKGGWNAEKEAIYLKELKQSHDKTVQAFDRLWEVEDHQQYDDVLNNDLDHTIGKDPSHQRDPNFAIGYMRGESRAIEMGYDSQHLYALGQIGMQEQHMKKHAANLQKQIAKTKNPQAKQRLEEQQKQLAEYRKEFDRFKQEIWNKRVYGKAEMEAVGKQVDDFFAAHQEKYADIQKHQEFNKVPLGYIKEEAAKAEPIAQRGIAKADVIALQHAATSILTYTGSMDSVYKTSPILMDLANYHHEYLDQARNKEVLNLSDNIDKVLDEEIRKAENAPKEFQHGAKFKKNYLELEKLHVDNMRHGFSFDRNKNLASKAFGVCDGIVASCAHAYLQPGNEARFEKILEEIPLDIFVEKAVEHQKHHQDFELHKNDMTATERRKARQNLNAEKRVLIELGKDLNQRLKNPSQEVKNFFVNESQLDDVQTERGFGGMIGAFSKDIQKVDVPEAGSFDRSLEKFKTKRAAIFRQETETHRLMREQAETVQNNLKILQSGAIKDPATGNERAITYQEKVKLLKGTFSAINELDKKADAYIAASTKKGTTTPNTPTGKDRLAAAREIKVLTSQLKLSLTWDPTLQEQLAVEKHVKTQERIQARNLKATMKKLDEECKTFQEMSQNSAHEEGPDSGAFGLNRLEYQAAKVVAIASVKEAYSQGKIAANDIQKKVHQSTRSIAGDQSFVDWVKKASETPGKMEKLGKMSPEEVRADFVQSLSKEMSKENAEPKLKGTKRKVTQKPELVYEGP